MEIIRTEIDGLLIIKPNVFGDSRGYFLESFQKQKYEEAGIALDFVQDNESLSSKGVLRGLHFQLPPFTQGKLVRVLTGSVLDVAVDLRKASKTYGHHVAVELNSTNKLQFWIPPGFAHGFLTLEDNTTFLYKCTEYYNKPSEECILWSDNDLKIKWGVENPLVSEKDQAGILFKNFKSPF